MLAGTKDSVDHLVPRSEELLTQTQRQERAISNAHLDLTQKANRIIEELSEVQKWKSCKHIATVCPFYMETSPFSGTSKRFNPKKWWEANKIYNAFWILPLFLVLAPRIILD